MTNSTEPEVLAIKRRFANILATQPVPQIPESQRPGANKKRNRKNRGKNVGKSNS